MKKRLSKPSTIGPGEDVGEALALLSETLVEEEKRIRDDGAKAMTSGSYDTATEVIAFAKKLLAFQNKVASLESEWRELESASDLATPDARKIVGKRFFGKKRKGQVTPHHAYFRPLLEVLVEMGGSGKTKTVLDRLGEKMRKTLKPVDYEPHKSGSHSIRWRNSAQWARNTMVNEDGRMKKSSPRGVWEISDKGRKWLSTNR